MPVYFDNASTTLISPNALKEYENTALHYWGNPSSIHSFGSEAKKKLEDERSKIADLLGIKSNQLYFTSGATESISLFLTSLLWHEKGEILTTKIEHEAVSSLFPILKNYGWKITYLKTKGGKTDSNELKEKLNPDVRAVVVMSVNNVNGALLPVKEINDQIREYEKSINHKILLFSDSVQALGKTGFSLTESGVDGASFSSHKINGPRGLGLLYLKNSASFRPVAAAGGQEKGKRGGTENLPAIAAMRVALSEWMEDTEREKRAKQINSYLREELKKEGFRINSPEDASPFILNFSGFLPSEVYTRILRDNGFAVSSGSACSNNAKGKTEVILEAMGIKNADGKKAIRVSFDRSSTLQEAEDFIKVIRKNNGKH